LRTCGRTEESDCQHYGPKPGEDIQSICHAILANVSAIGIAMATSTVHLEAVDTIDRTMPVPLCSVLDNDLAAAYDVAVLFSTRSAAAQNIE